MKKKKLDAFEDASERDIKCGEALIKSCPKCGDDLVWNAEEKKHQCVNMIGGCFYMGG